MATPQPLFATLTNYKFVKHLLHAGLASAMSASGWLAGNLIH